MKLSSNKGDHLKHDAQAKNDFKAGTLKIVGRELLKRTSTHPAVLET